MLFVVCVCFHLFVVLGVVVVCRAVMVCLWCVLSLVVVCCCEFLV